MSTPVVMPQMGESIAEGTIVRWIKKVGDSVDRDEPLFEISTDKVDAEIPSPAAGVLLDIAVKEGETVPVNSVVATIGAAGETGRRRAPRAGACGASSCGERQPCLERQAAPPAPQADGSPACRRPSRRRPRRRPQPSQAVERAAGAPALQRDDLRRQKSSPLVRRIAKEHGVDICARSAGTGIGGRVTKHDILELPGAAGPSRSPSHPHAAARAAQRRPPCGQPRRSPAAASVSKSSRCR